MDGSSAIYDILSARLGLKIKYFLLTIEGAAKSVWALSFGLGLFIWLDFYGPLSVSRGSLWSPESLPKQVRIASKKIARPLACHWDGVRSTVLRPVLGTNPHSTQSHPSPEK